MLLLEEFANPECRALEALNMGHLPQNVSCKALVAHEYELGS